MRVQTVLVPLDGSAVAEAALPMAEEVLRDNPDATLVLMRATSVMALPVIDPVEAEVAAVREAEAYLEKVAARMREAGIRQVVTSVWCGSPATSIVEAARARKADLIVMCTHGRSGIGRLVLGSVAESVVRGTSTPILLVRAAGAPVDRPAGRPMARRRGSKAASSAGRTRRVRPSRVWTPATITNVLQRPPVAISRRATAAGGFSQKRRTRRNPGNGSGPPGSIQPYSGSGTSGSTPRRTTRRGSCSATS